MKVESLATGSFVLVSGYDISLPNKPHYFFKYYYSSSSSCIHARTYGRKNTLTHTRTHAYTTTYLPHVTHWIYIFFPFASWWSRSLCAALCCIRSFACAPLCSKRRKLSRRRASPTAGGRSPFSTAFWSLCLCCRYTGLARYAHACACACVCVFVLACVRGCVWLWRRKASPMASGRNSFRSLCLCCGFTGLAICAYMCVCVRVCVCVCACVRGVE